MIIVEGPDGAGKSTLVRELQEQFPTLLEGKRGVKDRDKLWEVTRPDTYRALAKCLLDPNPYIWDRLFYSEFAYHKITPRDCQFGAADIAVIPQVIKALRAPVIFCMPNYSTVKANAAAEHQMDGVNENLSEIYSTYEAMVVNSTMVPHGMNLMFYDYNCSSTRKDMIIRQVRTYLDARPVHS